ncbi:MAG: tetratricopeptide repeat protein [Actinomycetota bacterium]|nr:tetratricopeptide repeat protein [Actinomycetota bacterium]
MTSQHGSSGRDRAPRARGRRSSNHGTKRQVVHLPDDVVGELKATARPGKGDILVQVFAEAVTAFGEENMAEAIRLGDQAKHIALRSGSVREMLGLSYYRNGQFKEAARELSAFRRLAGSTEQNPVLADCYRAMQKPERAIELCDELDDSVPDAIRYEGAIVAAGALADMERVDEAIARIETLDLEPASAADHHLRAWYVLGDLLERRGRFTQSLSYFEAVAAADAESTDAPERARRLKRR